QNSITCPVCKTGNLINGNNSYSCDHFKSNDDKCVFKIYHSYFKKNITDVILKQLVEDGETDVFHDLISSKDIISSAKLVINEGVVKPEFVQDYLESKCPVCKNKLSVNEKVVFCKNEDSTEQCTFIFSRTIAGHKLSKKQLEQITNGDKSDFIEDFTSAKGNPFGARIYLEQDENDGGQMEFNTKFDFEVIKCPKCKEGKISANERAFGCSNWNNENNKCDFTMWRNISG